MKKEKSLLLIGILIISLPNLGLPNIAEKITSLFFGIILIAIAYSLHFERNAKQNSIKEVKIKEPRIRKSVKIENKVKQSVVEEKKEEEEDVVVVSTTLPKEEMTGFTFIKKETVKHD